MAENNKTTSAVNHLRLSHFEAPLALQATTSGPRGRFNYYYPNSAHWLSQSFRESPMATSTPPQSPIGRSRSVSLGSVSQLESFSFPSASNLSRRPPSKVPPPSFCDTSVPPPNPPLMDFPYDVSFQTGKSRWDVKLLTAVEVFIQFITGWDLILAMKTALAGWNLLLL